MTLFDPMLLIILCNVLLGICLRLFFSYHNYIIIDWLIVPVQLWKSPLVHREKCTVKMSLTRQQWCAVLSGLRDAKKLKELVVHMNWMVCLVT